MAPVAAEPGRRDSPPAPRSVFAVRAAGGSAPVVGVVESMVLRRGCPSFFDSSARLFASASSSSIRPSCARCPNVLRFGTVCRIPWRLRAGDDRLRRGSSDQASGTVRTGRSKEKNRLEPIVSDVAAVVVGGEVPGIDHHIEKVANGISASSRRFEPPPSESARRYPRKPFGRSPSAWRGPPRNAAFASSAGRGSSSGGISPAFRALSTFAQRSATSTVSMSREDRRVARRRLHHRRDGISCNARGERPSAFRRALPFLAAAATAAVGRPTKIVAVATNTRRPVPPVLRGQVFAYASRAALLRRTPRPASQRRGPTPGEA